MQTNEAQLPLFVLEAQRGQLDRRQLIRQAIAAGISLPALSAGLAQRARAAPATPVASPAAAMPPAAARQPATREFSGVALTDPYAWLENPDDPAVIAYLEAENAYRESVMAPTAMLQETLYNEFVSRIPQTDSWAPIPYKGNYYLTRIEEGQQYEIYSRRLGGLDGPEEVLLDLNAMVTDYIALGLYAVSPDQRYLAYSINEDGGIEYRLSILDMTTGETLAETMPNVDSVAWAADSQTFFYTLQDPETLRSASLYRHTIGDDPADDPLLAREEDEIFSLYVGRSLDEAIIFAQSWSATSTETRWLAADAPTGEWTLFAPRQPDLIYDLEHHAGRFLLRTNDAAVNFQVFTMPVADSTAATPLLPASDARLYEWLLPLRDYLVIGGRERGMTQLWVHTFATGATAPLTFPETVFTVYADANWQADTATVRYSYTSLVTPFSTYDHNLATGERTLVKENEVVGGHNPDDYHTEQLFATAADGTAVPISLVWRRTSDTGPRPLLLDGYGAYGISFDPTFSRLVLSLLDRGMAYAIAHVRGGQELGRAWYEDGKLLAKKNTFTDFIACAEHLVETGVTAPDHLVAIGGSAGGMLMGAVANMRPELFHAIVAQVPFVDVLRAMLDPSLPLTTGEFVEWGNPADPEFGAYIAAYSPYDNVTAQAYPHLLITGGIDDDQVPYWQPAKWVAKLRYERTDDRLTLLRMNLGAGHGGASGRYDYWGEIAHDYAAILLLLGLTEAEPAPPAGATPVATRRSRRGGVTA